MKTKNTFLKILCLIPLLLTVSETYAEPASISQQIQQLLRSTQAVAQASTAQTGASKESPRSTVASDGYLRHIGAPPGHYFPVTSPVPGNPEATARNFLQERGRLFGVISPAADFRVMRTKKMAGRDCVQFQQTYATLDVFAGQVIVLLNAVGGVEYVMSDIARDVTVLDEGIVPVAALITAEEALTKAKSLFATEDPNSEITATEPGLVIFDPGVLGAAGSIRLVWDMKVHSQERAYINEHILIDAHGGEIVRRYPLNIPARDREVYDAADTESDPGTLERSEGEGPVGEPNVDDVYDFLGDAYDFYDSEHGRDSIDDGGMVISATVRFCSLNTNICGNPLQCPCSNAFWSSGSNRLYFGNAYTADDVVGHEYTHGVTSFESKLEYEGQSGAISESFSDMWGEFIDLTNGAGNDNPNVRWLHREDHPFGDNRNMQDPPAHSSLLGGIWIAHPDRLGSPDFYIGPDDHGGVHHNCGVGNKLAYLLTDGDTFNGQTVTGMGISAVADLYYFVTAFPLIDPGGDYLDLGNALEQAAMLMLWPTAARNNLYRALVAVEIFRGRDIYVNWAHSGPEEGTPVLPFNTISEGNSAIYPGNRLWIIAGSYDESVTFSKAMQIKVWGSGTVVIGQ